MVKLTMTFVYGVVTPVLVNMKFYSENDRTSSTKPYVYGSLWAPWPAGRPALYAKLLKVKYLSHTSAVITLLNAKLHTMENHIATMDSNIGMMVQPLKVFQARN